ncbi:MAG: hypothetical protein V7731_01345 [Amphritea sp.]
MFLKNGIENFAGFEFAAFRLKKGVNEEQLIAMSQQVDGKFLCDKDGVLGHFLLKGSDGLYADVAIATTQQRAEEVCQEWLSNDTTKQYLELLDPESVKMTFWSRIS